MPENDIISFRGTRQGILMSIKEDEPFGKVMDELKNRIDNELDFFGQSPISLDLGWREMDEYDIDELLYYLQQNGLKLLGIISTSLNTRKIAESRGLKVIIGRLGLAGHHGRKKPALQNKAIARPQARTSVPGINRPACETLFVRKTIRSGQVIEHPGNFVIMGDVNPGAEVRAGGDIVIVGALRGIAHAGRNPETKSASISAFRFQPTQIRIKDKIESRFDKSITKHKKPVVAILDNGKIKYTVY
ncbi:MAG: septum site-determining protein MinC [Candidatus Eremiobacteraeota bacterium]|nr:septum site-determining protein MinC [Candidatus Eremiobacteraeota bacterium]